jgi:hypothetical protein
MMKTTHLAVHVLFGVAVTAAGCQPNKPAAAPSTQPGLAEASFREPTHRVEVMTRPNNDVAGSLVGKKVRVQIRRDALGMAGNAPTELVGRWAAESSVSGTVVEVTDQWVVVDVAPNRRTFVPQASILIIEQTP